MAAVSADDGLHELVTNDVTFFKTAKGDAIHTAERLQGFDQAAPFVVWQVDLGWIPSDDRF